ncbi:MAG: hypothetical protein DKT66_09790 [Candidatus Melainabacteria bacterium]|nr:MAG: hypothetical protein DKT66_09790 [Candidatus Melainabacteria bacterium]
MSNKSPLGDRGKAAEDQWAREQDRQAIEKMKTKDGTKKDGEKEGCGCKGSKKSGTCADHDKTDPKDCCKKKKK